LDVEEIGREEYAGRDVRLRAPAVASALAVALSSCAFRHYEARPLHPEESALEFSTHSLDSPELEAFARANLPADRSFPPAAWDLESLTQVAFFYRAEPRVSQAELAVARGAVRTSRARPNPNLVVDPELVANAAGPAEMWVLGGILDLTIETANKRELRTLAAEARARGAELDVYAAAWSVRAEVVAAVAELLAARADLAALDAEETAVSARLEDLDRQLEAGRVSHLVLSQAEQELARLRRDVEAARTRGESALADLALALGVPRTALGSLPLATPHAGELPAAPDALAARDLGLPRRLDLAQGLIEYAVAEAELRLEIARQYPDLQLGPGASYDQGEHKYILGFALDLPVFDRNQGPIAEAEARRAAAGERFLARQASAIGTIEGARLRYAGALRERTAAHAALANGRRLEDRFERAVAAGAASRGELLDARVASARLARSVAESDANALRALDELELELQRPLVGELDLAPFARPPVEDAGA